MELIKRFSDRNKLSYYMNIAFGLSLLMITLWFQFGNTTVTTEGAIIELDGGYITERNQVVRIIEGLISIGLIILGGERICNAKKEK